jgi:hypothetical protein
VIIEAATQRDLEIFCDLVSYQITPSLRGIKLVDGTEVIACAGFDYWTPNSAQMHIWVGRILTRRFIKEVFTYLFVTNKKELAIGVTPGDNKAALDFNRRIGFRKVYEVKDGWDLGTSMVIQELRKHECIWIGGSDGSDTARRNASVSGADATSRVAA